MFGQPLGEIYRTVPSAGAAEAEHQVCESAFQIIVNMPVRQCCGVTGKVPGLGIALQIFYDGDIEACEAAVLGQPSGIGQSPAVEHIAATVAGGVLRYAVFI